MNRVRHANGIPVFQYTGKPVFRFYREFSNPLPQHKKRAATVRGPFGFFE